MRLKVGFVESKRIKNDLLERALHSFRDLNEYLKVTDEDDSADLWALFNHEASEIGLQRKQILLRILRRARLYDTRRWERAIHAQIKPKDRYVRKSIVSPSLTVR